MGTLSLLFSLARLQRLQSLSQIQQFLDCFARLLVLPSCPQYQSLHAVEFVSLVLENPFFVASLFVFALPQLIGPGLVAGVLDQFRRHFGQSLGQ